MALDKKDELKAAKRAEATRAVVGHPRERWDLLIELVQSDAVKLFDDVAIDFLELMWCLDAYRAAEAPPEGMGKPQDPWRQRIEGVYRGKGNWFAMLLSLLLNNRTGEQIRSRGAIKGYSQDHQIDLAWPDRGVRPIVCAESKVSGGPAYGDNPSRRALADWSNRRKEMKFAATDLKLARRAQNEDIGHWDTWRRDALPKCFMLWAARLGPKDKVEKMVSEATAISATYLDGAGIVAWRTNATGDAYELVGLPGGGTDSRVFSLDDALWQVESEIKKAKSRGLDLLD